ncbi:MAG: heparinase II/III family protein [Bacteroidota bacterium]
MTLLVRSTFVALAVAMALPVQGQSLYETYTGWAVDTTPVLPEAEAHPQLWFGADDLDALRAKWEDPAYADVVARVRADIARYKSRNPESTDPGDRSQMAKALAFAWIVDGDLVARVRGYQALLLAYENVPRAATSANFTGDLDEIRRATWLQNFVAAYDWLFDVLTPEDEATIRAALAQETSLLADNMVSGVRYAPRPHNHRSKPAYAVGSAALTLSDHPEAAGWLELALEQLNTTTRYQFSADGVYREGSHYWLYTLVNGIPFLWHYREAGVDLFPAYQPAFEWPVQTRTGRGWMPALEDGFPKPAPTHMVAAAYADAPTSLHTTASLGEVLQWNWATTEFFTDNYTGATNDVVWSVDEFITMDLSIPATAPDVSPTVRLESGQVAFRSDWNAGDPATRMLLFHGVASADNHDHPDLLSYTLDAENTPLSVDAGYGPGGFSDDRRDAWYLTARAHNVVTVGGFPVRDVSTNDNEGPEQTAFLDGAAFDVAEMFAPNNGVIGGATVRRGIAFLDDEYFAVYDHIEAANPASLQVHVHGRGTPTRAGNTATWTAPNDAIGDGGRLHVSFVADGPITYDAFDGWTSFYFSREEAQESVVARRNAASATFLHTLTATPASGTAPAVTDRTDGDLVAAEMTTASGAWHLATQRTDGTRTAGRVTTDAAFAAVGRDGDAASRWGVVRGTDLRWDCLALLEADAPVTVSADHRGGQVQTFDVASEGATTLTLQLLPATTVAQGVTLDDEPLSFEALPDGRVRITLPEAGTLMVTTDLPTSTASAPEAMPLRLGVAPNPSAGAVRLTLDLPASGPVRVGLYDALGRRVATLADTVLPAGPHDLTWGGRADGAPVAAGVYVAVAEAGGLRATTSIVRL